MGADPTAPRSDRARAARTVLSGADIQRVLTRIAHEILESNRGAQDLILLGIPSRGVPLAQRLGEIVARIDPSFDAAASVGQLDVTLYRDDLRRSTSRLSLIHI